MVSPFARRILFFCFCFLICIVDWMFDIVRIGNVQFRLARLSNGYTENAVVRFAWACRFSRSCTVITVMTRYIQSSCGTTVMSISGVTISVAKPHFL